MLRRFAISLLVTALPVVGLAQTSVYSSMTLAGSFQGWNPGANNMTLVSNNTWRMDLFLTGPSTNEYKVAANGSWNVNWGRSSVWPSYAPPYTNFLVSSSQFNGQLNVPADGIYRFTFNSATRQMMVALVGHNQQGTNLLRNSSFEVEGSAPDQPGFWQNGFPDVYGDHWGNSGRADWRDDTPDGSDFLAYIGSGSFGGFWQDGIAGRGLDYEFSISAWADVEPPYGPWTATVAAVKMEFFKADRSTLISEVSTPLQGYSNGWTRFSVRGTAPSEAAYVRAVVYADGVGPLGSLQLDVAELREVPPTLQSFDIWPVRELFSTNAYQGWAVYNGKVTTNRALFGNSVQLKGDGSASYVVSPYLKSGAGSLSFRYRNASTAADEENLPPASFRVETSLGSLQSWSLAQTISTIQALDFETYSLNITNPSVRYVRITASTGDDLLLDDIQMGEPIGGNPRTQDFNEWVSTNSGCHTSNDWVICSGRAINGTAVLDASMTVSNYLQTPFYEGGYGAISFDYARGTNGSGSAVLAIQDSEDGTTWSTLRIVSNIVKTSFTSFSEFLYEPRGRFLRIINVPGVYQPGIAILVDEPFTAGSSPVPDGWTFNGVGEYTTASSSGADPKSLKFDGTGDNIVTPPLSTPTNLSFWAKGNSTTPASSLKVEGLISGNWSTLTTYNNFGAEQTYNLAINPIVEQIRFTYTEDAGNVAFDDVVILGGAGAGPVTNQQLVLDNVSIATPVGTYYQDFNAWPRKTQYASGTDSFGGWTVANTIIDNQYAYEGQVARLNSNAAGRVESHWLPTGFGSLSYKARTWSGASSTLTVLISTNGIGWTPIYSSAISGTSYNETLLFTNIQTGVYLRFWNLGTDRILLDNIDIRQTGEPATVEINGTTDPAAPTSETPVTLIANVRPRNGALISTVEAYYRVGTNGGYSILTMASSGYNEYTATTQIPRQFAGTIVQYFYRVTYTGPGAASPAYYPTTAPGIPAQYGIPRAAPGQVWINEVKYVNGLEGFATPSAEFVELAGPAGFNLGGWKIQLFNYPPGSTSNLVPVTYYTHVIQSGFLIANDITNYGFYVLGNTNAQNRDATMTTNMITSIPFGIRLLNEGGGVEQELAFGGSMGGFDAVVPFDDFFIEPGVSLMGTGGVYNSFAWTNANDGFFFPDSPNVSPTPGAANGGQQFTIEYVAPEAFITELVMKTNVQFKVVGNVDNWAVQPMMTTNLMADPVAWTMVTPFNNLRITGTNQVSFAFPAGVTNPTFSIRLTAPAPED